MVNWDSQPPYTMLKTLVNFCGYTAAYAGKSFSYRHYGLLGRFRLFQVLMQLLIKSKYRASEPVVQRGFGFILHAPDPQLLLQLVLEVFVEQSYYFQTDKAVPNIIDGGANIGISVLYFKHLYPNAHIVAIEPNPAALSYLEKNIVENNLKGIRIVPAALAAHEGVGNLYIRPSLLNASLIAAPEADSLQVTTQKLSTYLKGNRVDLVKLDIEGAEEEVIGEIAEQGEIHNARQYIIEYHPAADLPEGMANLKNLFMGIGYTMPENHPNRGNKTAPSLVNFLYKSPRFLPTYAGGL